MSKNILFITEQLFKERTGASNAIDGKQLRPMIKVAQDIHIQPVLGSTLYLRLQDGIDDNDLNNDEKIDYIKVIDNVEGDTHFIVLQVAINDKENQDVAVFSVSKDENKQIQIQLN